MVLISLAFAAENAGYLSVGVGERYFPALKGFVLAHPTFRVAVGARAGPVDVYGLLVASTFDALWYPELQVLPGDGSTVQLGSGVRLAVVDSAVLFAVRADLGAASFLSPVIEEYESEIGETTTGRASLGAFGDVGVELGWNAIPDAAAVYVTTETGYLTNPGFGFEVGAGVGFLGRF